MRADLDVYDDKRSLDKLLVAGMIEKYADIAKRH